MKDWCTSLIARVHAPAYFCCFQAALSHTDSQSAWNRYQLHATMLSWMNEAMSSSACYGSVDHYGVRNMTVADALQALKV